MATTAEKKKLHELEGAVNVLIEEKKAADRKSRETERDRKVREEKEAAVTALLENLAELGGKMFSDDDIVFSGDTLVIPTNMTLIQARTFLEKKEEELERESQFTRTFPYRPYDGAYCMWNVLKRHFGAVAHKDSIRYTMFGPMKEPPAMLSVPVDVGRQDQIPWGRFELPFLPGAILETLEQATPDMGPLFHVKVTGPKKYRFEIEGIFNLITSELETGSLYRGKAFDGQAMPEFVDVWSVDRNKVVYSAEVMAQLEANVWGQLRHTEQFERLGIPLKRAVLIHGPYGTGKTLAALLTGQEAVQNNWTFIKARPGRDNLATVLQTARLYQPCVVFYEDVDQVADAESLDRPGISRLLDDFDGIEAKGTRILCVLTTNHPERIHKGMARPGRLDAMIEIADLDEGGVRMLIQARIPKESMDEAIDWSAVYEASTGYRPAFVTETADRAIRFVLVRTGGNMNGTRIGTDDLVHAANGLRPQFQKMEEASDKPTPNDLDTVIRRSVERSVAETMVGHFGFDDAHPDPDQQVTRAKLGPAFNGR